MDRKLNYLFSFLGIGIFIFFADPRQQWNIFLGLLLAGSFSFLAFLFRRLTLDGMIAATVIGVFIFGMGGWGPAIVVLVFFISSAIISGSWEVKAPDLPNEARRNGLQVWANGFWLVVFLMLEVIFPIDLFLIGALGAIATATADTWGTELGSTDYGATYLITTFDHVEPGSDGGVSIKGTLAALVGSALIAAVSSIYVFSLQLSVFLCIFIAGFLGSVMDSYFGATFQRNDWSISLPGLPTEIRIGNNWVNALATGVGSLLAIILKLVLS